MTLADVAPLVGIIDPVLPTVYGKPGCVQCRATTRWMEARGVRFAYVDVTEDQEAYERVTSLGYKQVPVVEVGSEHWSGFNPGRLEVLNG